MELVHVNDIREGQVLAQSVFDETGRALLRRGVMLTQRLAQLLVSHGIHYVYVTDREFGQDLPDLLYEETRTAAARALEGVFSDIRFGNAFALRQVREAVSDMVHDLLSRPFAVHALTEVRTIEEYTTGHSIGVSALSILIAMTLGYPYDRLYDVAMGALLHDVGKAVIPREILYKEGPLTEAEMEIVKEHTTYGFQFLRKLQGVSLPAAHIAYQHHERLDGSGYPRGLSGDDIHPYARIVAVADMYDALTTDRPYRTRLRPDQAVRIILSGAGVKLDRQVCAALLRRVAIYPPGTRVRLSTGEVGVVSCLRPELPARPDVHVIEDAGGNRLAQPYTLKLLQHPEVRIVEVAPHSPAATRSPAARSD